MQRKTEKFHLEEISEWSYNMFMFEKVESEKSQTTTLLTKVKGVFHSFVS